MGRLYSLIDVPELNQTANYITATVNQRFFQSFNGSESVIALSPNFRIRSQLLTWEEYNALQRSNLRSVPLDQMPEVLTHFVNCSDCYFMPSLVMNLETEAVTPPAHSMVNSLHGTLVDVDLCLAKSRKLFFALNAQGQPPFQSTILGLPPLYLSLIKMSIQQSYPYELTVGIIDTVIWSISVADTFFIEIRDSFDRSSQGSKSKSYCLN